MNLLRNCARKKVQWSRVGGPFHRRGRGAPALPSPALPLPPNRVAIRTATRAAQSATRFHLLKPPTEPTHLDDTSAPWTTGPARHRPGLFLSPVEEVFPGNMETHDFPRGGPHRDSDVSSGVPLSAATVHFTVRAHTSTIAPVRSSQPSCQTDFRAPSRMGPHRQSNIPGLTTYCINKIYPTRCLCRVGHTVLGLCMWACSMIVSQATGGTVHPHNFVLSVFLSSF
jgi:hypothetical protein